MENIKTKQLKYFITSFGCQMNYADAELFAAIVEEIGALPADNINEANLIILNTCSVRQSAEDRVLGLGRKREELKHKNPELQIVVTGCMARRSWQGTAKTGSPIQMTQADRELQLQKTMPWVNHVLESKDFYKLPELLGFKIKHEVTDYLSFKPKIKSKFQAFVPISVGCDHFCTYCIVPFARGREVCRPSTDIIKEVKELVAQGYTDITLLGQTVNRWIAPKFDAEYKKGAIANTRIPELNTKPLSQAQLRDSACEPKDFLQLLQLIDEIPGDYWLTFMSSHPNYMTSELIDFLSQAKHFRPYLHFALQSGSDAVLKKMNRRYNIAEFKQIAQEFTNKIPGLGLSTDVIVGFPGETEADFAETCKVMEDLQFDMCFISEMSPRKGTAAALIKDDVTHEEKGRRKKFLNDEVLAKTAEVKNKAMVGTTQKVLIEKIISKGKNKFTMGRTGNYKEIRLAGVENPESLLGKFIPAKVTKATPWALEGEAIFA
jgi:tRNA-2-methylthio-N6-dimethylallyladenosine synthase